MAEIKSISVLGCGWFGLPFAQSLTADGYIVKGSTTTRAKLDLLVKSQIRPYLIDASIAQFDDEFFECDVLLVNIPPKKQIDQPSHYVNQVNAILKKALIHQVKQLIFIGSTGIFEDGNFTVDERVTPKPHTIAGQKLQLAETALFSQKELMITIVRFGGLIGPQRNLAKFFAGRTQVENGLAPVNLISLTDAVNLCRSIIKQKAFGKIYHGVHPDHPTRKDFYTALCEASSMERPTFLAERKEWKKVESTQLSSIGFSFEFTSWEQWIAAKANSL